MAKYLKHPGLEKLFPRINFYLFRNTSTLLIMQDLVKVTIVHPKFIQYTNILLSVGWQSHLTLGHDILIDEALLLWKGRLS